MLIEFKFAFTKNEKIWNRQIKVSNQFTWAKNTIQKTILWTSKYQPKESVFGYLDLVELHHKEQNDAENIVALVANNEIDLALKRIESFGGTDKEGLQRKFILYMLCFMELILLESKTQPWRKEALEKILKHFDEQLPIDHSILNWNDFFPSYLIFQIACELAEMGFNYLLLYKRTDDWDSDWISTKGPYFDFQFDVLFSCVLEISIDSKKNSALIEISISLAKQGKIEKSDSTMLDVITYTRDISDSSTKSIALMEISTAFAVIGNKLEAVDSYMQEAISCVNTLKFDYIKSITLSQISNELIKQGKLEKAISIVEDINDVEQKSLTFSEISIAFAKLGKKKESSYYFKGINFDYLKSITLCKISNELFKQGNIEEANLVIKEAISFAKIISDELSMCDALIEISNTFDKQGKIVLATSTLQEALTLSNNINVIWMKNLVLQKISSNLANQNKLVEAYECVNNISDSYEDKCLALKGIVEILAKKVDIDKALYFASYIFINSERIKALKEIFAQIAKLDKIKESNSVIKESLFYDHKVFDDYKKCLILKEISNKLIKHGNEVDSAFMLQKVIYYSKKIEDLSKKSYMFSIISNSLITQGKLDESTDAIKEAINCVNRIYDRLDANIIMKEITYILFKLGLFEDALSFARDLRYHSDIIEALCYISTKLALQNRLEESKTVMQETLDFIYDVRNNLTKVFGLSIVSYSFAKQGDFSQANNFLTKALTYIDIIEDNEDKSEAFKNISIALKKQGKLNEANSAIREALKFAQGIFCLNIKSRAIQAISIEIFFQEKFQFAESTSLEIPIQNDFQSCWKEIAKTQIEEKGATIALETLSHLQNEEVRKYYLKGWAENVTINDLTEELLLQALLLLKDDPESIEHLLQTHAINELFFGEATNEVIQQYNRTLNIQWAMDIKQQIDSDTNSEKTVLNS